MQEFFSNLHGVEAVLWYIAIPSSIVFLSIMVLTIVGLDGSDGVDADFDSDLETGDGVDDRPFQLLGFRNLVAFLTMFSWVGLGCHYAGMGIVALSIWSTFAGLSFVIALTTIFYFFYKMQQDNTPKSKEAIGKIATVYLQVPAKGQGTGKINVTFGGGFRELEARTNNELDYPTNSQVKIVDIENGIAVIDDVK